MSSMLSNIVSGQQPHPPRIIVYGAHGTGKSTFAANAPKPIFIQTEDGAGSLDVDKFPLAKSYDDVIAQLRGLAEEDHEYQTLVIDSLDWLETLIWAKLIQDRPTDEKNRPVKDITDYGYGKGYDHAMEYWQQIIDAIDYLRDHKAMMVICTAHAEIKRFDDPEADPL